jgi:transcriptional regulator GlxA family with amidase domain
MRIQVLVLDGVFDSGLAAILDTLETANALAPTLRRTVAPFEVTVVGMRRRAVTHQGLRIALAPLPARRPEVVVMPAIGAKTPETIAAALESGDAAAVQPVLREWGARGACIAGACTATFVIAAAGLLDGGRATTTWWLSPLFRQRHPAVALDESSMIVEWRRVVTAGAALAHFDLALWLVRQKSPTLAQITARHLVFDSRPSQAPFVMPDHLAHSDPLVEKFEAWARRHLASFSLRAAARACGTSERTLERRIRAVLGRTPLSYVRDLRVEQAVHRLRTSRDSIDEIAAEVGYQDGVTLRTLLRQRTGRGVRELRAT